MSEKQKTQLKFAISINIKNRYKTAISCRLANDRLIQLNSFYKRFLSDRLIPKNITHFPQKISN
uniref:Uncharacterized protein n=1 Tax=Rhizophora mucronata TaxID=61149 RepID=A0A2P2QKQ0_RHIMU